MTRLTEKHKDLIDSCHIETQLSKLGTKRDPATGAISMPIHHSATFEHPGFGQSTGFDYSRSLNPTRLALEEGIAQLEQGHMGFAFSSGMAAITAVLHLFSPGDHLIVTEDAYGGTYRLLETLFKKYGLMCTFVDTTDLDAVKSALTEKTRGIIVESPTNPLVKVADLGALIAWAGASKILSIVDNTFMTPILQKPIVLGADYVVHSASKYLGGHNDVIAGLVVTKTPSQSEAMAFIQKSTGAILGPQDSWLLMRGMKTLALRMRCQCESAAKIAQWLGAHPAVQRVYYPGLGAMLSFTLKNKDECAILLQNLELIHFAESLGGTESLITFPATQTHADMPPAFREGLGIDDTLLRFSVGIEHVDDLIQDFEQALNLVTQA